MAVTYQVLQFLGDTLNESLKNQFALSENKVVVNKMAEADGGISPSNQNKVVLTFMSIEEESTLRQLPIRDASEGVKNKGNYSIYLLLSSNFDDYPEALKLFDAAIDFFKARPVFDKRSYPNFPPELDNISVELCPISLDQIINIWASSDLRYQPTVLFKARVMPS